MVHFYKKGRPTSSRATIPKISTCRTYSKRAAALAKAGKKLGTFRAGLHCWFSARMRETSIQSVQMGKRRGTWTQSASVKAAMFGRLPLTARAPCLRARKTTSRETQVHVPQPQALVLLPESVCAEFLGMQKEDVHHSIISSCSKARMKIVED